MFVFIQELVCVFKKRDADETDGAKLALDVTAPCVAQVTPSRPGEAKSV